VAAGPVLCPDEALADRRSRTVLVPSLFAEQRAALAALSPITVELRGGGVLETVPLVGGAA